MALFYGQIRMKFYLFIDAIFSVMNRTHFYIHQAYFTHMTTITPLLQPNG